MPTNRKIGIILFMIGLVVATLGGIKLNHTPFSEHVNTLKALVVLCVGSVYLINGIYYTVKAAIEDAV